MARNDHSGYPMKWFKDGNAARRDYECVICLEVVKDAVQVRGCGHQFCALCVDDILQADPRCPSCRIAITDIMVFEDHAARRKIKELEVNCCNEGCTWTGCLGSLLQNHQNNCNFLTQRDDNNAQKLKVEELEQKHDTLMLDVFLFKEKHEQDITDLKLKHEQDIAELKLKHEEDIQELKLKYQKDIGDLQVKHEQEKKEIRELQLKQQQEKQLQLKHEQDIKELKLKLQRTEDFWRRMKKEEKDLCEKEIRQKFSPVVEENVTPVEIIPVESDKPLEEDLSWEDKEEKIGDEVKAKKENGAGLPEIEVAVGCSSGRSDYLPFFARQKSQLKRSENPWQRPRKTEKQLSRKEKKSAKLYRNVVAILNKLTPQKFKTLVEQIMALNIDTPERLEGVVDRIFEKAIREPMYSAVYANMCRCLFPIKVADAEGKEVLFRKLLFRRCQKEFEKEREDEQALLEKNNQLEGLSEEQRKVEKEEMDKALLNDKRRMLGNIKFIGELFKLKLLAETVMHDCIFKLLRAGDEESLESMCKLIFTIGKDLDSDKAKPRIDQYFDQIEKIIVTKKVSSRVVFMLRDVVELRDNKWIPRREENYNPKTIDQIHKDVEMEKKEERRLAAQLPSKDNKQKKAGPVGGRGRITPGKGGKSAPIDQNKLRSIAKGANNEKISLGPSSRFGQWGRGSSAGNNNSSQEQDQPLGNRYSALSSGGDMSSSRPYDPRKSGSRPLSGGLRGSDTSRIKGDKDRESALEAVRNLTKPQISQPPLTSQERQEVKVSKELKEIFNGTFKWAVKEPLSEEELAKKTTALIDEYANIRDLREAVECFTDLHSPGLHHLFILTAVEHTYEMTPRARHDTGRLFAELLSQKMLSKEQVTTGFDIVLELAYDNSIDYPMLWRYLADIFTPVVLADQFTLSDLKPLILKHLISVGEAAALLAEILLITKELKGEGKAAEIWRNLGLSWSVVLPDRSSKEDFLSQKNLNFLLNENDDELLKLLRAKEFKIDTVFAHIEKSFKEEKRKEANFINRLVTAVAESCMINADEETGPDCCKQRLKARKDILRKYLDNDIDLELEALFALQEIYVKYNKPAAMLPQFFNTLYDEEVLTEEAFMKWKQDESPSRQDDKGPALHATASFFDWIQSAAVEGGEN